MWHEFIQLREEYLKQMTHRGDVYREYIRNKLLYETFKLAGNDLPEQEFLEIISTDKRLHGQVALKAYDLWQAWKYVRMQADAHVKFDVDLIRAIAAKVMRHTGEEVTTSIGRYDTSLGDFRLGEDYNAVYPIADYAKIPDSLNSLCRETNVCLMENSVVELIKTGIYFLFDFFHIRPFGAGNMEVAILSMNYIFLYHRQPLLMIFGEDRPLLLNAIKSRDMSKTPDEFEDFVLQEQIKFLSSEV